MVTTSPPALVFHFAGKSPTASCAKSSTARTLSPGTKSNFEYAANVGATGVDEDVLEDVLSVVDVPELSAVVPPPELPPSDAGSLSPLTPSSTPFSTSSRPLSIA